YAAGGVVKVDGFILGVLCQPPAALRKRNRVRDYAADLICGYSGPGNQVVPDAHEALAQDADGPRQQQIVVLCHRSVEAVLNWQHGGVDCTTLYPLEDLG